MIETPTPAHFPVNVIVNVLCIANIHVGVTVLEQTCVDIANNANKLNNRIIIVVVGGGQGHLYWTFLWGTINVGIYYKAKKWIEELAWVFRQLA